MICFHTQNTSKRLFACKDKVEDVAFDLNTLYKDNKIMNERDLMKLAESMEEFSISDFTVEELQKLKGENSNFKDKYFDYYDDVKDRTRKKQDW